MDSTINWINLYPLDSTIGFPNTYPLVSDLSSRERYPPFEQLRPGVHQSGRSHQRQVISRNHHSFTNQWLAPNATQCSVNALAFESSAFEAFYGGQLSLINSTDRSKFNLILILNFDWSKAPGIVSILKKILKTFYLPILI